MNNDYKLNLYEGNSLQLDIQKEFGIEKFDIVIGNPPYNEDVCKWIPLMRVVIETRG